MDEETQLICIAGDDAYLLYYYECQNCGTVVIENHGDPQHVKEHVKDYDCPICYPDQEDFPFKYVPPARLDEYKLPVPYIDENGELRRGETTLRERLERGFV